MKRLILVILLGVSVSMYSMPHYINNIGGADGLGDLLVNYIHEDELGMVWLGTGNGVGWFDGVRVHYYPLPGKTSPQKRVTAIVGSPGTRLIAGNGYGMAIQFLYLHL